MFGVSQPTISRMVSTLEEPIAAVLDCEVPELVEVISGRVIIVDGTLIPTGNRAAHRELYSGKRHRSGAAVQILAGTDGRLRHVGEPLAGSTHDVTAFRDTGLASVLEEHMHENMVIGDLGYLGEPVCTPVKKPPKGELSPSQIDANKHLSGIRAAVERCIAHLKNWKTLAIGYRRLSRPGAATSRAHSAPRGSRRTGRRREAAKVERPQRGRTTLRRDERRPHSRRPGNHNRPTRPSLDPLRAPLTRPSRRAKWPVRGTEK